MIKTVNCENQKEKNILKLEKIRNYIENLKNDVKMKFWIKTLLSSFSTLPEIIKTVDKIIELQASSMSFCSDIYNREGSSYCQLEKVIDMSERKNNLVNLYVLIKELYRSLDIENAEIIEKKYLYGYSCEDIAKELGVSTRTIYRRIDKIVDQIYDTCKMRNWSLAFIESQLKDEGWIKERFIKIVTEYFKNINYSESYSMSSSGL